MPKKLSSSTAAHKARVMAVASVLVSHYSQVYSTPSMAIDRARYMAQVLVSFSEDVSLDTFMAHFALGRLRSGDEHPANIAQEAWIAARDISSDIEAIS